MAVNANAGENGQPEGPAFRVDDGPVALDHSGLFQKLHAAGARRRRQANAFRQRDVRNQLLPLQFRQDIFQSITSSSKLAGIAIIPPYLLEARQILPGQAGHFATIAIIFWHKVMNYVGSG